MSAGSGEPCQRKGAAYYAADRVDFLDWVGGNHERVLDVGCSSGSNAAWLRAHGARQIVGIEPDLASAELARARYD
nr:class I SAM-dependent methyltransferase [Candidatus Limnocylindrales bacterium]